MATEPIHAAAAMPEPENENGHVVIHEDEMSPGGHARRMLHARENPLSLTWTNLKFTASTAEGDKELLHGVSGWAKAGELTAIMGPSGAGKTTLLNTLAGRASYGRVTSGEIFVNGRAVDPSLYRQNLAYVMQQDALFPTMTVWESLTFTAAMKLPHLSEDERAQRVQNAINTLKLQDCANTLIGSVLRPGVSGGEKKRTAVAVELISEPTLIFLDEPTSGLDSHSAFELVQELRKLADAGCTIVCTIHQPSSEIFDLFHAVHFFRKGLNMYSGTVPGIAPYFGKTLQVDCGPHTNLSDFAMLHLQICDDKGSAALHDACPVVPRPAEDTFNGLPEVHMAGVGTQFKYLFIREARNLLRDKASLGARFGMGIMLAIVLGLVYLGVGNEWGEDDDLVDQQVKLQNHWGATVFNAINVMFLTAQPMLLAFPLERPVFIREYMAGQYGCVPYLLGKTAVDLPTIFLANCFQTAIFYTMVDLEGFFPFLVFAQTLLGGCSSSLAILLGCAVKQAQVAVQLVPAVYVPQILFAGFFISSDQIPVFMRWIQWICPLKYGISLITVIEFADDVVPYNRTDVVDQLINRNELNRDQWYFFVLILIIMIVFFRSVAALLLRKRAQEFA